MRMQKSRMCSMGGMPSIHWCGARIAYITKTITMDIRMTDADGDRTKHRMQMTFAVLEKGKTMSKKCCDNCSYYRWYYDYCDRWGCKVDGRSVCDEHKERKDND